MRKFAIFIAIVVMALTASLTWAAPHPGNPGGNCDGFDGPNKVDTSDGSIVLPAGTLVCIKAGDSNTGTLTADGTSTLADLIEASGLLNNGGQVPNVSNYVTYGTVTETTTTTDTTVTETTTTDTTTTETTTTETTTTDTTSTETTDTTTTTTDDPATPNPTLPASDTEATSNGAPTPLLGLVILLISGITLILMLTLPKRGRL